MATTFTPWMTSDQLIAAVKRKISFPVFQGTFSEQDILDFATEEMMISQVPSVLQFHEEYYTFTVEIELFANKKKYPIPERAIGMKLRDVFLMDTNGNLFETTRIAQDDRGFFQRQPGTNQNVNKYFLQGNDVVLCTEGVPQNGSKLLFVYYIRPSILVPNERAAIISYFTKSITVDNTTILPGDTVTIGDAVFTAVSSSPLSGEFLIGTTSVETATNLNASITMLDVVDNVNNGSPSTNVVTVGYLDLDLSFSVSNSVGFVLQSDQGIEFDSVPSNITNGSVIDFLQTRPGHKIKKIDILLGDNSVSQTNISFNIDDLPEDVVVGDYICLANESIIPYLPTDLHTALAERTCARILAAIGDQQGLAATNEKIQEIELRQGNILTNRVEGSQIKVRPRNSLLGRGKIGRGNRGAF